jgi:hypothetical protein
MTRDDIIRMAREAGIPETATEGVFIANSDDLGRLIATEREACAKVCDEMAAKDKLSNYYQVAALAIRARGQA